MASGGEWTSEEQSRLEDGLVKFVSLCNLRDKWDAIAGHVGSRSAKECAARFKECRSIAQASAKKGVGANKEAEETRADDQASWKGGDQSWSSWWQSGGNGTSSWDATDGSGWSANGNWSGGDWNDNRQEVPAQASEDSDAELDAEARDRKARAREMKQQVEANRERLRLRSEREEQEKLRKAAKEEEEREIKRKEHAEYLEKRQKEFEERAEQERQRKLREAELLRKAQEAAQPANAGFGPARKGGGKGGGALAGWAAKAAGAQKGQAMREQRQRELERQAAEVMANIQASSGAKKAPVPVEAEAAAVPVPEAEPASSSARPSGRAPRAPIGPRQGPQPADDEEAVADEGAASSEEPAAPAAASSKAAAPRGRTAPAKQRWWSKIDGDCPISLAPLGELPSPPFGLEAEGSSSLHYFDARFLANFLLSSCDFIDPVNRRQLRHEECVALDAHLRRHHRDDGDEASVADAFALFEKFGTRSRDSQEVHAVQREATAVLHHLFQFRTARRQDRTGRAINYNDGGLTVVDDDDILANAPPPRTASSVLPPPLAAAAAAPAGSSGPASRTAQVPDDEMAFPTLPGAKAKAKPAPQPKAQQKAAGGKGGSKGKPGSKGHVARTAAGRSAWGKPPA